MIATVDETGVGQRRVDCCQTHLEQMVRVADFRILSVKPYDPEAA